MIEVEYSQTIILHYQVLPSMDDFSGTVVAFIHLCAAVKESYVKCSLVSLKLLFHKCFPINF